MKLRGMVDGANYVSTFDAYEAWPRNARRSRSSTPWRKPASTTRKCAPTPPTEDELKQHYEKAGKAFEVGVKRTCEVLIAEVERRAQADQQSATPTPARTTTARATRGRSRAGPRTTPTRRPRRAGPSANPRTTVPRRTAKRRTATRKTTPRRKTIRAKGRGPEEGRAQERHGNGGRRRRPLRAAGRRQARGRPEAGSAGEARRGAHAGSGGQAG